MIGQAQQNPHVDRITEILKNRAQQSAPTISPQQYNAMGIANIASGAGPEAFLQAIQGINRDKLEQFRYNQQSEIEGEKTLYDVFEQQRTAGDKQAQALFDRMNMFTGGDPAGNQLFLEQLNADPEDIDPSNAYQVMTKLAGIAKKTGYVSPEQQMNRMRLQEAQLGIEGAKLDMDKTRAQIADIRQQLTAGAKPEAGSGSKQAAGTGVERMRDWYIAQGVPPLEAASLAQKGAGVGNAYIPGQGITPIANVNTLDTIDKTLNEIDAVIKHPGLPSRTGYSSMISPFWQGYAAQDVQARIEQLKGSGFLDAYETLKGSGQITEVEGKKATDARVRMEQAVSQDDFIKALKEWSDIIKIGRDRLQNQLKKPTIYGEQGQGSNPAITTPYDQIKPRDLDADPLGLR